MVAGSVGTTCEGRYSAINTLVFHLVSNDGRARISARPPTPASMSSYSHNIKRFFDDGVSLDLAMQKLVPSVSFRWSEYLDNGWQQGCTIEVILERGFAQIGNSNPRRWFIHRERQASEHGDMLALVRICTYYVPPIQSGNFMFPFL